MNCMCTPTYAELREEPPPGVVHVAPAWVRQVKHHGDCMLPNGIQVFDGGAWITVWGAERAAARVHVPLSEESMNIIDGVPA